MNSAFVHVVGIAVGYFLLGELGLLLAIPPGYASAIFPASAIAGVMALHLGFRALPGIWLGSFALNISIAWQSIHLDFTGQSLIVATSIGFGASLQAWLTACLVRWRIKDAWQRLDQDRDIFAFLILAGPLGCLCASSWAVMNLLLFDIITPSEVFFTWWNWWAGDTLGVLLFAPILVSLLYYSKPCWQTRMRSVVVPTILLTVSIVTIYVYVSDRDTKLLKYRFAASGESLVHLMSQQLQAYHETVGALARLMSIAPNLSQTHFTSFIEPIFVQHSDVHALSWNPVVASDQRQRFEKHFGQENKLPNFHITERDQSGSLIPAHERDWYVAVGYIAPLEANVKALGYDIASNSERLGAIQTAMKSRQMTATSPIRLVQDSSDRTGLLLLEPVYGDQAISQQMPIGFAVGVFKVEEMLIKQTSQYLPPYLGLNIEDLGAEEKKRVVYSNHEPLSKGQQPFIWQRTLNFAGRDWQITLYPTTQFFANERSLFAWSILATGLVVTSMLQAMLLGMTGRALAIQRQVDEQTKAISEQAAILQDNQRYLHNEKVKYETLLHASGDGIYILDLNSQLVEANQKFCDMLGYSRAEIIGKPISLWEASSDAETLKSQIKASFAKAHVYETKHRCKNGEIIEVEISAKSVNINGERLLWNASRDIGERKRLQQALTEAKEAAERAMDLKSRFLANMSHEIRTPMNGIIGLSELALTMPCSSEMRDCLEKLAYSSQSLLGILNDILDLSKLEADGIKLINSPFRIDQIVDRLRDLFGQYANSKSLDLTFVVEPEVPRVLIGDILRLQQILSNLISNAIKFTEHGGVTVKVSMEEQLGSQALVCFSVTDTGFGISEEARKQLFKPFSQGDNSITRKFGGTGLGLAISNSLLQMMGSEFKVVSIPERGSTFSFDLMLDIATASELWSQKLGDLQNEAGELAKSLEQCREYLKGARILVVEDNRINQHVVKGFLSRAGVDVTLASNGQEALDFIQAQDFDAVLMDIQMPVMDGLEATRQIRANPKFIDLPIIALTAGVTKEERDDCLLSGMNDLVAKPVNSDLLVSVLARWI